MNKFLVFILLAVPALTFTENLTDAVINNDIIFIKNYNGDLNEPLAGDGKTALMLAARLGRAEAVKQRDE